MIKFTVDQFGEANGTDKPVAYGFLRFLAEKGLVSTSKADKAPNTRGKPAVVYSFTPELAATLGVVEYVHVLAVAPVVAAVVVEQTAPEALAAA